MRETDPRLTWMRANSGTLLLILSTLFFPPSLYLSLFSSSRSCFLCFFFFGVILRFCFPEKKIGLEFSGTTRLLCFLLFPIRSIADGGSSILIELRASTGDTVRILFISFSFIFRQFYSFRIGGEFFIFTSCGGKKKDISFVFDNLTILFLSFKLIGLSYL